MKYFLTLFLGFTLAHISDAQKYDYVWPFGYDGNLTNYFGISALEFNNQEVITYPYTEIDKFSLGSAGSFISNKNGELLLITNNCEIVNKNFDIIEGGTELNPGPIHDEYCVQFGDYPSFQTNFFLPELTNDSTYYLVHRDNELWVAEQNVVSKNLYLSIIIHRHDGSFYLKEKKTLFSQNMATIGIIPCRTDDEKWWVFTVDYNSNNFNKFLIGGDNLIEGPYTQSIGLSLGGKDLIDGQVTFSPNRKLFAINTRELGILLYDFNHETGELSNFRTISYPNPELLAAKGLVFSPNSRFIYSNIADNIYQIDLEDPDSTSAVFHVAKHWTPDETGWPIGIGYTYLGPDCRIYVSSGTGTFYIHVIHEPNEKGIACQFEPKAIKTPTRLDHHLPNVPLYRTEENLCDPDIEWVITSTTEVEKERGVLVVFPNPANSQITIQLPKENGIRQLTIRDILGKTILVIPVNEFDREKKADISKFNSGVYFITDDTNSSEASKLIISK